MSGLGAAERARGSIKCLPQLLSEARSAGVEVAQNLATKYEKRQHGVIHPTRIGPDPMPRLQHISAMYRLPKSMEVPQKARNYGRSAAVQRVCALRD